MPSLKMDDDCIKNCSACSEICFQAAINHCLYVGGKHIEPEHFKLMLDCAKICETSACLQMTGSRFSNQLCRVCADICEACADSCERVGDMEECVIECRKCAASCRKMAA